MTQHGSGPAGWAKFDAILSAIEGLRAPLPLAAAAGIPACASGSAPAAGAHSTRSIPTPDATRPQATCGCSGSTAQARTEAGSAPARADRNWRASPWL